MEVEKSSETSVTIYQLTQRHITEYLDIQQDCSAKPQSINMFTFLLYTCIPGLQLQRFVTIDYKLLKKL
jgi:hypothetical protein